MPTIDEAIASVNRIWREFLRYTGDGLPGEPLNAPLPIGDPSTGVKQPNKAELRGMMTTVLQAVAEALEDIETGAVPDNGVSTAKIQDGAVSEPKLASSLQNKLSVLVTGRAALAEFTGSTYRLADLIETGRNGLFYWDGSNLSARVTADPAQGIYVPPTATPSGASGAWVRQFTGDVRAEWFGLSTAGTAAANTLAINRAITVADLLGCGVALPAGEFDIDAGAGAGIVIRTGLRIYGQGKKKTILNVRNGGSLTQLRNYQAGAAFRRDFNMAGANAYVEQVLIEKMAIVLNHPLAAVTTTAIQIAVDFRNVTRSRLTDCWIGNYHPITDHKGGTRPYLVQGYAVVCGNESGQSSYAGGEVNVIDHNFIVGAYRAVCIDDNNLNTAQGSAAYSTRVEGNDIQIAQILVYQASQYGAGNVIRDNVLQALQVRQGNADTITAGIWIDGYGNLIEEPYIELGNSASFILRYGGSSKRNRAKFSSTCSTTGGTITEGGHRGFRDAGGGTGGNIIEFYADTAGGGSYNSQGSPQRMVSGTTTTVT